MKTASTATVTYLNATMGKNTVLQLTHLYTLTLATGTIYRWTDYDIDLVVGGNTFSHNGPAIVRGASRQVSGVERGTMEITLDVGNSSSAPTIGGLTVPMAAITGLLDNATFEVDKLFMSTPGSVSMGATKWFVGLVAEVEPSSSSVKLRLIDSTDLLQTLQWPKRLLFPQCPYSLYSPECGVAKPGLYYYVIASSPAPSQTVFTIVGSNHPAFTLGSIQWGAEIRQIQNMAPGVGTNDIITVNYPFNGTVTGGGSVGILPGCNKSLTQLGSNSYNCTKFGGNFGGFPSVPRPESMR